QLDPLARALDQGAPRRSDEGRRAAGRGPLACPAHRGGRGGVEHRRVHQRFRRGRRPHPRRNDRRVGGSGHPPRSGRQPGAHAPRLRVERRDAAARGPLRSSRSGGRLMSDRRLRNNDNQEGARMTHHPKERLDSVNRRNFLLKSAGVAVSLSAAGPLLAACGNTTNVAQSTGSSGELVGPGGLPLARPNKRVVLPRWEDPMASGLQPETGGTFPVFNSPSYLYRKLLNEFGAKYNVDVQYTPFDNVNSGLQRLASGAVNPDVTNITPDVLDIGVAGKL